MINTPFGGIIQPGDKLGFPDPKHGDPDAVYGETTGDFSTIVTKDGTYTISGTELGVYKRSIGL
jgi:hypothetical protein